MNCHYHRTVGNSKTLTLIFVITTIICVLGKKGLNIQLKSGLCMFISAGQTYTPSVTINYTRAHFDIKILVKQIMYVKLKFGACTKVFNTE